MNAKSEQSGRWSLPLATGLGLGLSPVASGTVGSIWGVLLVWAMQALPGTTWQCAAAGMLTVLAIPICDAAERYYGKKDDGRIVADEYLTFPLCMLGLPFTPWVIAMCFVSNRVFDIAKPPPANRLQSLQGGVGVVVDDVLASVYSLAFNHLAYWVITTYVI